MTFINIIEKSYQNCLKVATIVSGLSSIVYGGCLASRITLQNGLMQFTDFSKSIHQYHAFGPPTVPEIHAYGAIVTGLCMLMIGYLFHYGIPWSSRANLSNPKPTPA